jgi:hypothetical protein
MCDTTHRGMHGSDVARPRWGLLYGTALPQLAALGALEVVQSPHAVRIALRCLLAFGVFAAMSILLRANRPAFDLQNWCECAGERMTIRVIESRRPQPAASPLDRPALVPAPAEEEYEVVAR